MATKTLMSRRSYNHKNFTDQRIFNCRDDSKTFVLPGHSRFSRLIQHDKCEAHFHQKL